VTARRTFYKTSAAARAARRVIDRNQAARASETAPLLLSYRQWKAAATALAMLQKRAFGRGNTLIYTTAAETALASDRVLAGVLWPVSLPLRAGWLVVGVVRDRRAARTLRKTAPALPEARARKNDGGSLWR
jgi:hypothetical protein